MDSNNNLRPFRPTKADLRAGSQDATKRYLAQRSKEAKKSPSGGLKSCLTELLEAGKNLTMEEVAAEIRFRIANLEGELSFNGDTETRLALLTEELVEIEGIIAKTKENMRAALHPTEPASEFATQSPLQMA